MPSLPADTAWVEHGWTTPYYIINSLAIMTYMPMRSYVEPEYLQKMELPDSSLKEVPLSTVSSGGDGGGARLVAGS